MLSPLAEVADRAGVQAAVGSLDLDRESLGRNHQVGHGRSDSSWFAVASNGHEVEIIFGVSVGVGGLQREPKPRAAVLARRNVRRSQHGSPRWWLGRQTV